jgi:hypothetical protein
MQKINIIHVIFHMSLNANMQMKLADSSAGISFLANISKYVIELTVVVGSLVIAGLLFSTQSAMRAIAVLSIFLAATTRIAPAVLRVQQGLLQIKGSIGVAAPTLDLLEDLYNEESIENMNQGSWATLELQIKYGFTPDEKSMSKFKSVLLCAVGLLMPLFTEDINQDLEAISADLQEE